MADTVQFSTVDNPASWDTQEHGSIEFANHAEAKKAEALFTSMQQKINSYEQATPGDPILYAISKTDGSFLAVNKEVYDTLARAYAALKVKFDEDERVCLKLLEQISDLQIELAAREKDAKRWREHSKIMGAKGLPGALLISLTMGAEASGTKHYWGVEAVVSTQEIKDSKLKSKAVAARVEQKAHELFSAIDAALKENKHE